MTVPEWFLTLGAGAILALQGWMLTAIVALKVELASVKGTLEQIEKNL